MKKKNMNAVFLISCVQGEILWNVIVKVLLISFTVVLCKVKLFFSYD